MISVELIDYFGNDLMVVNAARVSYNKSKTVFDDKDARLIKYLVAHKHTAPFRHPQLQFRIECPIYVERQLFKHQIGMTASSRSGRYVDFSDSYTKIKEWRKQSKDSKQGSCGEVEDQEACDNVEDKVIEICKEAYNSLLSLGVSKEQARAVLPLSLNTQFIWTGSLAAFIHLFELRIKPDAQQETREVAEKMLNLLKGLDGDPFKHSLEAHGL